MGSEQLDGCFSLRMSWGCGHRNGRLQTKDQLPKQLTTCLAGQTVCCKWPGASVHHLSVVQQSYLNMPMGSSCLSPSMRSRREQREDLYAVCDLVLSTLNWLSLYTQRGILKNTRKVPPSKGWVKTMWTGFNTAVIDVNFIILSLKKKKEKSVSFFDSTVVLCPVNSIFFYFLWS